MDIQALIQGQAPELLETLRGAGLSGEQAQDFLPAAGDELSSAVESGGIGDLLGGGGIDGLLQNVDIAALAGRVGIDPGLARTALEAILPKLLEGLKAGGVGGLLGGLGSKLLG